MKILSLLLAWEQRWHCHTDRHNALEAFPNGQIWLYYIFAAHQEYIPDIHVVCWNINRKQFQISLRRLHAHNIGHVRGQSTMLIVSSSKYLTYAGRSLTGLFITWSTVSPVMKPKAYSPWRGCLTMTHSRKERAFSFSGFKPAVTCSQHRGISQSHRTI